MLGSATFATGVVGGASARQLGPVVPVAQNLVHLGDRRRHLVAVERRPASMAHDDALQPGQARAWSFRRRTPVLVCAASRRWLSRSVPRTQAAWLSSWPRCSSHSRVVRGSACPARSRALRRSPAASSASVMAVCRSPCGTVVLRWGCCLGRTVTSDLRMPPIGQSHRTWERGVGRSQDVSIDSVTLGDREGQRERAPTRLSARSGSESWTGTLMRTARQRFWTPDDCGSEQGLLCSLSRPSGSGQGFQNVTACQVSPPLSVSSSCPSMSP